MHLLAKVRRFVAQHNLIRPDTRVVVALSGGPDSVALAHAIAAFARAGELRFAGVAHFNHQLRETAARDEAFCRTVAKSLHVPIELGRDDVRELARRTRTSVEHAAHDARHAFLDAARKRLDADVIALGHTRDDQAETFLLRLLRGAGARGLAAMHPRNGAVIRPLLDCRRAEIVAWLGARGLGFVEDETNRDVAVPRNRVRAELMPLLESRFNPAIVDVLADAAELARGEWLWLEQAAEQVLLESATVRRGEIALDVTQLRGGTPVALVRLVVWRAMARLTARPVTFRHVSDAMTLLAPDADGRRIDLPGQVVKREGSRLVLTGRSAVRRSSPPDETNLFEYSLSIPGEVVVPEAGGVVTAEEIAAEDAGGNAANLIRGGGAVIRRDLCGTRLTVRNRRPGDRWHPVGLRGTKKLQDVFVDRKIARAERDRVPLVVDESGRILWVAGVGIAEEFRVTDRVQPMLILRFKVPGGPA